MPPFSLCNCFLFFIINPREKWENKKTFKILSRQIGSLFPCLKKTVKRVDMKPRLTEVGNNIRLIFSRLEHN
uniref:Uncharacterized protein n=1 Tax=Rhizophora mucronata TaxID=61149 RepID=A0A2P2Q5U9_RHIMU